MKLETVLKAMMEHLQSIQKEKDVAAKAANASGARGFIVLDMIDKFFEPVGDCPHRDCILILRKLMRLDKTAGMGKLIDFYSLFLNTANTLIEEAGA